MDTKWFIGYDLQDRWGISHDNLVQYLLDGDLKAYPNIISEPYNKEDIENYVLNCHENLWMYEHGVWGFNFRVDDVLEFEKLHNITVDHDDDKNETNSGTADKKLLTDQKAKNKCREVAKKLREQDPTITMAAAIRHKDMREVSKKKDGSFYLEKTIRDWIKDLWPEELRKPGRRKGT